MMIRLNRYLAMCGLASRRKAEELLLEGRVRVDGKIILLPSIQIDPERTEITLDGRPVKPTPHVYIVMNKPSGYVCAVSDKFDPVILEALPEKYREHRVFPVGRLDRETEGLLILSNDGDFANGITHPSFEITKEYEVRLDRHISEKALNRWKEGYEIDGRFVKPLELGIIDKMDDEPWVRVVIGEGLKREVREMVRLAGFWTKALIRRKIGKMELVKLNPGEFTELTKDDILHKIRNGGRV